MLLYNVKNKIKIVITYLHGLKIMINLVISIQNCKFSQNHIRLSFFMYNYQAVRTINC